LKRSIQIVLGGIVPNPLKAALRLGDGAVEPRHLLFGRRDLGGVRRQQVAALDGAEIGGEIVEVAEHARVGQPQLGDVGGQQVEIAQAPDAEQAQHDHQQEEHQEHRREVKPDRVRLAHVGRPSVR
jgi:hypothetical protein